MLTSLFILRIGLFMLKRNDIKVETIYQKGFHSFFLVKRKNGKYDVENFCLNLLTD
jgi:hypothetical protein